ncbi:MAG: GNAT family N-acetyltransferase [Parachlamydiaceae bacterium]|nr:GNAT family N-acetyltransferase [Parachlamydiaceae bacterium]
MILETERLILREFSMDDLHAFASLMADPEVMRFSLSGPMSKEKAKEYLQTRILDHYAKYGYGLYAVILKEDNQLIGQIGLISQNIDGVSKTELGYRLHTRYWGQGLATEGCLAVCQYAFEKLGKVDLISIIDPQNTRSLEVAKRAGMIMLKEASFYNIPVHIYTIKASGKTQNVIIRQLLEADIDKLARTFTFPWSDFDSTAKHWQQSFKEQQEGIRTICVLERQRQFLGYGSLLRESHYPFFKEKGIPEVNAIWVDEHSRRQGLAKRLIEHIENMARSEGYKTMGIGVGLYKDYGAAQRLYYKMDYQPDGNGITYKGDRVVPGSQHPVDDDLLIWLTKSL